MLLFSFFYSYFELNDNVCYWNVYFLEWISCFISILDSLSICCSSASLLCELCGIFTFLIHTFEDSVLVLVNQNPTCGVC